MLCWTTMVSIVDFLPIQLLDPLVMVENLQRQFYVADKVSLVFCV